MEQENSYTDSNETSTYVETKRDVTQHQHSKRRANRGCAKLFKHQLVLLVAVAVAPELIDPNISRQISL